MVARVVGIALAQVGGASAQSTVAQQLQGADLEVIGALAGHVAVGKELLQLFRFGKVALLVHAHRQLAFGFQLLISLVHLGVRDAAVDTVVIGLAAGDTVAVQLLAGFQHHFL